MRHRGDENTRTGAVFIVFVSHVFCAVLNYDPLITPKTQWSCLKTLTKEARKYA